MVAIVGSPSSRPRAAQPAWIRQHGVRMGDRVDRESKPPKPHGDPLEAAVNADPADRTTAAPAARTDAGPAGRPKAGPSDRRTAGRSGRRNDDAVVRGEAGAVIGTEGAAAVRDEVAALLRPAGPALARLLGGRHHDPHSILGAHRAHLAGEEGVVVRVMHHAADKAEVVLAGETH